MLLLLSGQENARKHLILTSLLYQTVPSLDLDAIVLIVLLSMLLLFNTLILVGARNLSSGIGFCCPPHCKTSHTKRFL